VRVLDRLERGKGKDGDADLLVDMATQIAGRSFCPLGDAAATPVLSGIKNFREDFEARVTNPQDEPHFIPDMAALNGH
jgi:NADH-quinone oxidoreductase subunit F